MEWQVKRRPERKDDRIILQFDYDCFYAQVFENKDPTLKPKAVGVRQKNILATCNYNARSRGVKKLMLISAAKKICPDLVLVDGEDLTPFRDTSKILFNFLRSHSWNNKVEKLGFDEVFMDVTDMIEYNMLCLNKLSLSESFFCLSDKDPERGFGCDLTSIAGCVEGTLPEEHDMNDPTYLRLALGSQLALYLRTKLEEDFGYTSTCGISMNKLLSKLVGSKNKPRNQTTLLAWTDEDVITFIDSHKLRNIPGLGFKTAQLLDEHVTSVTTEADSHSFESVVTARDVRLHPTISAGCLETLLSGPGAEKGVGTRIWGLLHGVDPTEVKEASDVPSQLSVEDTYKGLETFSRITEELHKLSYSLVRRMRVDLLGPDDGSNEVDARKWIARPKTLRLSIRSWPRAGSSQSLNYNRISRSGPLPNFIFDLKTDIEHIAERLVAEALLPLLRRLQSEKGHRWNLQLINICVANMVAGAGDDKAGVGRDIAFMFKHQDEALRPWKVAELSDEKRQDTPEESGLEGAGTAWEDTDSPPCAICGHAIPYFALSAHTRYHELGDS